MCERSEFCKIGFADLTLAGLSVPSSFIGILLPSKNGQGKNMQELISKLLCY